MKFEAVGHWIIAIPMLHAESRDSGIILPSIAKDTSRCYLIETVSEKAHEQGYSPGDIVVAKGGHDLKFYGGVFIRTVIDLQENRDNNIIMRVRDVRLNEFTTVDGKPILEIIGSDLAGSDLIRACEKRAV